MEQYLPLAEIFFNEMRKEGYFTALDTRATMQLMVNVLIGTTYSWALTGSGDIEEQALLYMDVLVKGLKKSD